MTEQASTGLQADTGELAAARQLDAEAATMGYALGWAVEHDLVTAARLVAALGLWWVMRRRLAGQEPLLRELAGHAEPGSGEWCVAQFWLACIASEAPDLPGALQRCAAIIDVTGNLGPSRMLADCLALQSSVLSNLGRLEEADAAARRALAMARVLGLNDTEHPPMGAAAAGGRCHRWRAAGAPSWPAT